VGWWIVTAAGGKDVGSPGSAWHFRAPGGDGGASAVDEITAVDAQRLHARRSELGCRTMGEHTWQCERSVKGGTQYFHLALHDGELVGTAGRQGETPYGQMTARRATSSEAAELEAVASRAKADADIACGRARRCYALACPAFGQPDDPCIFEHHSMSQDAESCTEMVPMLASVLRQLGKPVPAECSAPQSESGR
jgi:hypothetical protein